MTAIPPLYLQFFVWPHSILRVEKRDPWRSPVFIVLIVEILNSEIKKNIRPLSYAPAMDSSNFFTG